MKHIKIITLILAALLPTAPLHAAEAEKPAIELGAPFSDSAILQRGMPVPVWGWSKPGDKITVAFAGQKKTAEAGKDGKWMAKLDPLEASAEPREMTVTLGSGKSRVLKDILVGEVWMASGQSNMQWVASKCDVGMVLQKQIDARVAAGKEKPPVIRETKVTDFFASLQPIEHATGAWHAEAGDMSAVSYAFAYQLHRELGVPIGILNWWSALRRTDERARQRHEKTLWRRRCAILLHPPSQVTGSENHQTIRHPWPRRGSGNHRLAEWRGDPRLAGQRRKIV